MQAGATPFDHFPTKFCVYFLNYFFLRRKEYEKKPFRAVHALNLGKKHPGVTAGKNILNEARYETSLWANSEGTYIRESGTLEQEWEDETCFFKKNKSNVRLEKFLG